MKPTQQLHELGQSLWIDNITRTMLDDGTLAGYIEQLSLTGLTSNPTIFDKAIGSGDAYDEQIAELQGQGLEGEDLFFELALTDLKRAAELFAPINERTDDVDGWVSLEVSPLLADDSEATIQQVADLHGRAEGNVFIKIPGTEEGCEAIEEATFAGIPVNVTLLFSTDHYLGAADAYARGLERRIEAELEPMVPSVASLFVSRWDVAVSDQVGDDLRNRLGIAVGEAHLPRLPRAARIRALAAARQRGRAPAEAAVRKHGNQGPERLGRALRRGAGRARTPSTRCRRTRCWRSPTTATLASRFRPTAATPKRCWPRSRRQESTSARSPFGSRRRARSPSMPPGAICSARWSRSAKRWPEGTG